MKHYLGLTVERKWRMTKMDISISFQDDENVLELQEWLYNSVKMTKILNYILQTHEFYDR